MDYYFNLLVFLMPFLVVSPWQKYFGLPGGAIYAALAMILVLWQVIVKPDILRWHSIRQVPLAVPLLAFLGAGLLSLGWLAAAKGIHAVGMGSLVEMGYYIFAVVFYWAAVNYLDTRQRLTAALHVFTASAVAVSCYGLVRLFLYMAGSAYGEAYTWTVPRLAATTGEPQVLGGFLITILPLAAAVLLFGIRDLKSGWYYAAVPVLLMALVMTYSAGAWAGFALAGVFLALWFSYYRARQLVSLFLLFVLVGLGILLIDKTIYPNYLEAFSSITYKITGKVPAPEKFAHKDTFKVLMENSQIRPADKDAKYMESLRSKVERSWFRTALWNMFKSSPILGVGPGNFGPLYPDFKPPGSENPPYVPKPHNQYLQILAETGLLGLLSFGWVIVSLLAGVYQAWCSSLAEDRKLLLALFACLLAVGVHGYAFGILVHLQVWLMLALLVGLFPARTNLVRFIPRR